MRVICKVNVCCALLSCVIAFVGFGCKGNPIEIGPPIGRFVELLLVDQGEQFHRGEPVRFSAYIYEGEKDGGLTIQELVSLVEIAPGDGTGWHDVTEEYFVNYMTDEAHGQYSYNEIGEFRMSARVTYWDGQIVYSVGELVIEVLPEI